MTDAPILTEPAERIADARSSGDPRVTVYDDARRIGYRGPTTDGASSVEPRVTCCGAFSADAGCACLGGAA